MNKTIIIIILVCVSQVLIAKDTERTSKNILEKEKYLNKKSSKKEKGLNDSVPNFSKIQKKVALKKKGFLKIYPNPSTEYFMIEINDDDKEQSYEIQILSTNGVLVKHIKSISSSQIKIVGNDLKSGLYIVNVLKKDSSTLVCKSKVIVK